MLRRPAYFFFSKRIMKKFPTGFVYWAKNNTADKQPRFESGALTNILALTVTGCPVFKCLCDPEKKFVFQQLQHALRIFLYYINNRKINKYFKIGWDKNSSSSP